MKSSATSKFWRAYHSLPPEIRAEARKAYHLWKENPRHPSLRFERKGPLIHASRKAPFDSCVSISTADSSNTRTMIAWERAEALGSDLKHLILDPDFIAWRLSKTSKAALAQFAEIANDLKR
jgi:hypothetical protein